MAILPSQAWTLRGLLDSKFTKYIYVQQIYELLGVYEATPEPNRLNVQSFLFSLSVVTQRKTTIFVPILIS